MRIRANLRNALLATIALCAAYSALKLWAPDRPVIDRYGDAAEVATLRASTRDVPFVPWIVGPVKYGDKEQLPRWKDIPLAFQLNDGQTEMLMKDYAEATGKSMPSLEDEIPEGTPLNLPVSKPE